MPCQGQALHLTHVIQQHLKARLKWYTACILQGVLDRQWRWGQKRSASMWSSMTRTCLTGWSEPWGCRESTPYRTCSSTATVSLYTAVWMSTTTIWSMTSPSNRSCLQTVTHSLLQPRVCNIDKNNSYNWGFWNNDNYIYFLVFAVCFMLFFWLFRVNYDKKNCQ